MVGARYPHKGDSYAACRLRRLINQLPDLDTPSTMTIDRAADQGAGAMFASSPYQGPAGALYPSDCINVSVCEAI